MSKIFPRCWIMPALDDMDQKGRLLHAVNGAAELLLTTDEGFENALWEAMELIASCTKVDRIYIWQNIAKGDSLQYTQQFEWLGGSKTEGKTVHCREGFYYSESLPEWETQFLKGECVNGPLSSLSRAERERLEPYGIKSILAIPVYLQNIFWGFVSFDDCHVERTFTDDEVGILCSASLIITSAMDRRRTAAKMHEADERVKLMLDATPLGCSMWDHNINLVDCNEAVVNLYGLKDKQEYLDSFFELSPEYQPDGRRSSEKVLEYIAAAFRDGGAVYEWLHRMPDGTLMPAEVTLVRVMRGDELIVAGYTRDLREYNKMMREIAYKDSLLHMVNEAAAILLRPEIDEFEDDLHRCMGMVAHAVGADRMYIWKNHETDGRTYSSQLYEWSEGAEPQQGGAYTMDIPYSDVPRWEQQLSKGQCINGLVRNLSAEEQAYLYPQGVRSVLVVPVLLRNQFWGFVGFDDCHSERVFTDEEVSILHSASLLIANALLRNEMTHNISAAVERAQKASTAKGAFLAHMSHEIRTPMNVIAGMTELLLRENIPAAIYEHVMNIKHASTNMLSLVNDILDFSKIEAGSLDIVSAEYSLTSLINNILVIIRMKVSEKPIVFTANIDASIPNRLIGDETRIRQILLNVLDNAAKYTAEGFVALNITGEIEADTVVLSAEVADSGIGIRREDIDRLFGDFIRVDGEKNKSIQGTGLGLAITKSLCLAMGGNITVRSEYGTGSAFTITIPQKIKSRDEQFAKVSEPETKRVLLYETRPVYADSIVRSLDNLGVRRTLVSNEQDFCEALKRHHYPYVFVSSPLSESAGRIIEAQGLDTTLVLLTEYGEAPAMHNVRTIAAPAHAASIANILDDIEGNDLYGEGCRENVRFIAPSAQVLVVDDLNTNLKVVQGLMTPYQMQVDICGGGEEAVECAQKKRYDIIFMDHMMPGMNGIEAAARIRSIEDGNGYYRNVPIIALTANAISGVKEMFLRSGMNDFLAKPIDITKLHSLLEKWIPEQKKEKDRKAKVKSAADMEPAHLRIEGVDIQAGIAMTGGTVSGYLKTLAIFHMEGLDKAEKIRGCAAKNDLKLYTVYVHAMKSAAATIGAKRVADFSLVLEKAGARGDGAYILANTGLFLKELMVLLDNISAALAKYKGDPKRTNDPEFIRNELVKLKNALDNRDAGEIDDIMSTLDTVSWDEQAGDTFSSITKHILLIDYADAAVLVDKLIQG